MAEPDDDIEVITGQLVAQNMLLQTIMSQLLLLSTNRGAEVRQAIAAGISVLQQNPNMTKLERFGAVSTLEDALDTFDRARALFSD